MSGRDSLHVIRAAKIIELNSCYLMKVATKYSSYHFAYLCKKKKDT